MMKSEEILEKLRNYQHKLYGGSKMVLKNIKFECTRCKVHFTPSEYRAKNLMQDKGVINECEKCENGTSDVY
jgi:hypothetical protein